MALGGGCGDGGIHQNGYVRAFSLMQLLRSRFLCWRDPGVALRPSKVFERTKDNPGLWDAAPAGAGKICFVVDS